MAKIIENSRFGRLLKQKPPTQPANTGLNLDMSSKSAENHSPKVDPNASKTAQQDEIYYDPYDFDNVASHIYRTGSRIGSLFKYCFYGTDIDLNTEQFAILSYLWSHDHKADQSTIISHTLKNKSVVTRTLKGLEKDGLIKRATKEHDLRSKEIVLTDEGIELLKRAIPLVKQNNEYLVNKVLSPEERQFVSEKMQEILDLIEEMSAGL